MLDSSNGRVEYPTVNLSAKPPKATFEEMFARVWKVGTITRHERTRLAALLLQESISLEERASIDRLLHAIRRGWLQVID